MSSSEFTSRLQVINRNTIHQYFASHATFGANQKDSSSLTNDDGLARKLKTNLHLPAIILPVIHVESLEQTVRNVELIVNECGLYGCFLINHGYGYEELLPIIIKVREMFPQIWLGVNFLAVSGEKAFKILADLQEEHGCQVDGYWADNAWIEEKGEDQTKAEEIRKVQKDVSSKWNGLYLGGVCFKAQRTVEEEYWEAAARRSVGFVDVVMTSGVKTGQAAKLDKIEVMRRGVGPTKVLGVASGITPENVIEYLDLVDVLLVATGVSDDFHNLNKARLQLLIDNVRMYEHLWYEIGAIWRKPNTKACEIIDHPDAMPDKETVANYHTARPNHPQESRPSNSESVSLFVKQRKQYLVNMSGNVKDFAKYAWLDPSSICLYDLNILVKDLLAPFLINFTEKIDFVAGIDAAGFYYAGAMAAYLDCGFLSIRKVGKLCTNTDSVLYSDYTNQTKQLEMRQNVQLKGKVVLLMDQWIETGGTMGAAITLLENRGANIIGIVVVGSEAVPGDARYDKLKPYRIVEAVPTAIFHHELKTRDLKIMKQRLIL